MENNLILSKYMKDKNEGSAYEALGKFLSNNYKPFRRYTKKI